MERMQEMEHQEDPDQQERKAALDDADHQDLQDQL